MRIQFSAVSLLVSIIAAAPAHAEKPPVVYGVHLYAAGPHTNCSHSQGPVTLKLPESDRPVVLILSSFNPAVWSLQNADRAKLTRILATSGHWTRVTNVPAGVPVVRQSPYDLALDDDGKPLAKAPPGMKNFENGWEYDKDQPNMFYGDCSDRLPENRRMPIAGLERPGRHLGDGLPALSTAHAAAALRALGGGEPLILANEGTASQIDLTDPKYRIKPAVAAPESSGWCAFGDNLPGKSAKPDEIFKRQRPGSTSVWNLALPFGHRLQLRGMYGMVETFDIVSNGQSGDQCACFARPTNPLHSYDNIPGYCAPDQAAAQRIALTPSPGPVVPGFAAVPLVLADDLKPSLPREQFIATILAPLRTQAEDNITLDRAQLLVKAAEFNKTMLAQAGNRTRQQLLVYDADGDGAITRAEAEARLLPDLKQLAEVLMNDTNTDGRITADEMADPAPDPLAQPLDVADDKLAALLALSPDGRLSAARLTEIAEGAFDAVDTNHDTLLSDEEAAAFRAKLAR